MLRRKQIQELGKKAKHLFLFSDVDTNQYIDLNNNHFTKAWGALFNFRNKTKKSELYDEFENIMARNISGK
jgi:hypothetical protein